VIYSTYIGGSGFDQAVGIAVDAQGNAYVAGFTNSANFPTTTSGLQRTLGGDPRVDDDVFVLKLNPAGSTLVYSTYVGGSGFERASGITIDTDGNAYVAGFTDSTNFPTTTGAYQRTYAGGDQYGGGDAFVLKLDPIGSTLIYSTYIGKNTNDMATAITLDPQRNAYVTGYTDATDFPTSLGAFQTKNGGIGDVFIVKLDQTGSTLLYSTLVGGSTDDYAMGITADDQGTVYVTGYTLSSDFPVTNGSFQETFKGVFDAFVLKLDQTGSNLLYSTFVGGSTYDKAYSIAVDAEGIAYVTGSSNSVDFPTTYGAFQSGKLGSTDAFLFKLDHNGSHLINSSYLGGRAWSEAYAIDLDDQGGAYLAGFTSSTNFPVSENGFQRSFAGGYDAFMTKMAVADALPGPPIDLQGTSGYDQVTLTWRSPVMNGGGVDYYAVYQDEVDVAHSSTTTAMITGLTSGQSYDFWVRAHNSAGLGPASGTNTSSPSVDVVPGQPTGLHAVILDQQVTLGWDPPANNGTLPLIGYYVYYGESSADTRFGDLVPVGTNTSVISNLTSGAWYYFAVSAVSPVGEGARSSNVSVLINEINTTITGKVVDSAGEPLPDIRVELENGTYAITDAQGHFDLNTTPGNHTLTISGEGIKTEIINKTVPPGGMDLGTLSVTKAEEPSEPGDAMVYLVIAAVLALSAIGIAMIILARRRRGPKDQM
jgi:hypothetical protein